MGFAKDYLWAKLGLLGSRYWRAVLRGGDVQTQYDITAKQAGSGEPSPVNVRPILPGLRLVRDDDSVLEVYGGTLDTASGVLTVTWVSIDIITGRDNGVFSGNQQLAVGATGKKGGLTNFYSNIFGIGSFDYQMTGREATEFVEFRVPLDALNVSMSDSSKVRLAAFIAWLKDHSTKLCYELATPVTYQLTEAEVKRAVRELRR